MKIENKFKPDKGNMHSNILNHTDHESDFKYLNFKMIYHIKWITNQHGIN